MVLRIEDPRGLANRGRDLEDLLRKCNMEYRRMGMATVAKIPTEWLPIRNSRGKVIDCKVTEKAPMDFMGSCRLQNGICLTVAFDAKKTIDPRLPLDRVTENQAEWLTDNEKSGGASFVLGCYNDERYYVIPWPIWSAAQKAHQADNKKTASINVVELPSVMQAAWNRTEVDYLEVVDRLWDQDNWRWRETSLLERTKTVRGGGTKRTRRASA
jgi:recombination protein U